MSNQIRGEKRSRNKKRIISNISRGGKEEICQLNSFRHRSYLSTLGSGWGECVPAIVEANICKVREMIIIDQNEIMSGTYPKVDHHTYNFEIWLDVCVSELCHDIYIHMYTPIAVSASWT